MGGIGPQGKNPFWGLLLAILIMVGPSVIFGDTSLTSGPSSTSDSRPTRSIIEHTNGTSLTVEERWYVQDLAERASQVASQAESFKNAYKEVYSTYETYEKDLRQRILATSEATTEESTPQSSSTSDASPLSGDRDRMAPPPPPKKPTRAAPVPVATSREKISSKKERTQPSRKTIPEASSLPFTSEDSKKQAEVPKTGNPETQREEKRSTPAPDGDRKPTERPFFTPLPEPRRLLFSDFERPNTALPSRPVVPSEAYDNLRLYSLLIGNSPNLLSVEPKTQPRMLLSPLEFIMSLVGISPENTGKFLSQFFQTDHASDFLGDLEGWLKIPLEDTRKAGQTLDDPFYGGLVVVDSVVVDKFLAGVHLLMHPPARLHPYLRMLLYRLFVTDEMLRRYWAKRRKIEEIYNKAQAGKGKVRYKGQVWEYPIRPTLDDMGGDYALVVELDKYPQKQKGLGVLVTSRNVGSSMSSPTGKV